MVGCVRLQACMLVGLVLLSAIVFGAWIWSPLYIDMEEVVATTKQKADEVQQAAMAWYNRTFSKDKNNPEQTPESAAKQKEGVEISTSTSVAMKVDRNQTSSGARGTATSVQLTKGHGAMLLTRMKGASTAVPPIGCVHKCATFPSLATIKLLLWSGRPSLNAQSCTSSKVAVNESTANRAMSTRSPRLWLPNCHDCSHWFILACRHLLCSNLALMEVSENDLPGRVCSVSSKIGISFFQVLSTYDEVYDVPWCALPLELTQCHGKTIACLRILASVAQDAVCVAWQPRV
jgi:hypothetical protein